MENTSSLAGAAGVLLGVLLIGLGVAWPSLGGPPSESKKQKASEFLAAARQMESAASQSKEDRGAAMAAVREEYQAAREEIEIVKSAGQRTAFWMKLGGAVLAMGGVGGLMINRSE